MIYLVHAEYFYPKWDLNLVHVSAQPHTEEVMANLTTSPGKTLI